MKKSMFISSAAIVGIIIYDSPAQLDVLGKFESVTRQIRPVIVAERASSDSVLPQLLVSFSDATESVGFN